jgi:hypothetical protein
MVIYTTRRYANCAARFRYDIGIEKAAMESTSIWGWGDYSYVRYFVGEISL